MTADSAGETRRAFSRFAREAAAALSADGAPIAADIAGAFVRAAALQNLRAAEEGAVLSHFPAADKNLIAQIQNCLQNARADSSPLFFAAATLSPFLQWRAAGGGKSPRVAATELVGPCGLAECARFRAGLFFQPPRMFYAWHRHAAEEAYLPLHGAAEWRAETRPPAFVPPLRCVLHRAWQAHAMRTLDSPLLALWGWRGDIAMDSYEFCATPKTA